MHRLRPPNISSKRKKFDPDFVNTFAADDAYMRHIGPKSGCICVPSRVCQEIPVKFNWGVIPPLLLKEGLARYPKMVALKLRAWGSFEVEWKSKQNLKKFKKPVVADMLTGFIRSFLNTRLTTFPPIRSGKHNILVFGKHNLLELVKLQLAIHSYNWPYCI